MLSQDIKFRRQNTIAYTRFIALLQHADNNAEIAKKFGVSTRTVRRWKQLGIPEKSEKKIHRKLVRAHNKLIKDVAAFTEKTPQDYNPRIISYSHTNKYDGRHVVFYVVDGVSCENIQKLLVHLSEKRNSITGLKYFMGFYFQIRISAPEGARWDGEKLVERGGYPINNEIINTYYFDINAGADWIADKVKKYCQPGFMNILKIGLSVTRPKFAYQD